MRRFAGRRRFPSQSMARSRSARSGQRKHDIENGMTTESQIEKTFREEHGRVLAALISQLGDFELAEDALQDALVNALERWQSRRRSAQSRRLVDRPLQNDVPSIACAIPGLRNTRRRFPLPLRKRNLRWMTPFPMIDSS